MPDRCPRFRIPVYTVVLLAVLAGCEQSGKLTYRSWLPPTELANSEGMIPFFKRVERETEGAFSAEVFTQGQMVGQVETLAAIRDGAVDAGFIMANLTPSDLPYNTILADMQGLNRNPLAAAAATIETTLLRCPQCRAELERNEVIALGGHATAPYYLMCTRPLDSVDDIVGLRLRASLRFYADAARAFGATPVNVSFPEMVPALERGQVDCIIAVEYFLSGFNLYEIIRSVVTTRSFGTLTSAGLFTINRHVWAGLSADVRQSILRNLPVAIANATVAFNRQAKPALDNAVAHGVAAVDLGAPFATIADAFLGQERTRLVEVARELGVTDADQVIETYLDAYARWEGLVADIGDDAEAFAGLLWREIYSQLDR